MHSKKVIAFLLLFLFIEKAGLRLWIHTHYHTSASLLISKTKEDTTNHKSVSETGCDCMDDFFIPLSFSNDIIVISPAPRYFQVYYSHYKNSIAYFDTYSIQLRGPPAC